MGQLVVLVTGVGAIIGYGVLRSLAAFLSFRSIWAWTCTPQRLRDSIASAEFRPMRFRPAIPATRPFSKGCCGHIAPDLALHACQQEAARLLQHAARSVRRSRRRRLLPEQERTHQAVRRQNRRFYEAGGRKKTSDSIDSPLSSNFERIGRRAWSALAARTTPVCCDAKGIVEVGSADIFALHKRRLPATIFMAQKV